MKSITSKIFILSLFLVGACNFTPVTPEEQLLKKAFAAIKAENWETFSSLTITSADFILERSNIKPFKQKLTYAGGILKPEEKKRQKAEFQKASIGGPGLINFKKAKFVAIGSVVREGTFELIEGGEVSFRIFSAQIQQGGITQDTKNSAPLFVIVRWHKERRLLRLDFPP